MRHPRSLFAVLALAVPTSVALGQNGAKSEKTVAEKTTIKTTTKEVKKSGGANLTTELWAVEDARPIPANSVDLRLTGSWMTASFPANRGDSDDDFVMTPSLVWGMAENWELSFNVPIWLGDAGDRPGRLDGNADTHMALLWRFLEQEGYVPAMALKASARIPTGDHSEKLDGELRLIMTNEYDGGIRSHLNGFLITANGDNDLSGPLSHPENSKDLYFLDPDREPKGTRHFQWGLVIGMDGPLCDDGAVRWVIDYMNRSSYHYGSGNVNLLDVGWEWNMDESKKLGMSVQIGLDDNEDTPNFGATMTYAYSLNY